MATYCGLFVCAIVLESLPANADAQNAKMIAILAHPTDQLRNPAGRIAVVMATSIRLSRRCDKDKNDAAPAIAPKESAPVAIG